MKLLTIFYLLIFSYTSFATESLDLLIKLDKGLPSSGRNGSLLGEVISYIGDVNNDGHDDWAIGLPYAAIYKTGAINGKVYIYYGSSSISDNKNPDLILIGEKEYDRFGESVTCAGDVNNDGYSDILIACSRYVTIYYGGDPMDSDPDVILIKENKYGFFGVSISSSGDVNNDGYDDVVIGSKDYAYIYFGGSPMDSNSDVILKGESERDSFGFSVSKAGDMNHDGFDDVIIGAQGYYLNGYDAGRAYVYFGSSNMDSTADIIFTGENAGDYFGEIVSDAGDVNNDGYSDVIVSAPKYDGIEEDAGRVYIYFGNDSIDTIADITIDGKPTDSFFGGNVCSAGDINKDNFDDILIATLEYNYILLGGSLVDSIADIILTGSSAVAGKGDYNNDGFADVIAGEPNNDINGEDAGRVSIYYGGLEMDTAPDAMFYGEPAYDYFGSSVSYAGDLNRDGYSDVIVGSPFDNKGGRDAGCAYIYFGGKPMNANADITIMGKTEYGHLGTSVSFAGDVNADGSPDVIVGSNSGQAWIYLDLYLDHMSGDIVADFTFSDGRFGSGFGKCVSYAGDFNNDGYDDFIIGAYCDNTYGIHTGRAYIYFGGPFMGTIPEITLTGEAEFNNFGTSIAYAGDVNNDGFSDVIIGAPGYEVDEQNAGRVYVYYGNNSLDSEPDVVITGHPYKRIGYSIASAGDVNNDGYDDIIIGAPYFGAAPGGISYVYIYYGGDNMDANADVIFEKKNWLGFGTAVCRAGNFNNDDYDDVMIGGSGNVHIYYGGAKMDTIPDIIQKSEASSSGFGNSLSIAGDVNNDGYSDLLIGAPDHSAVGSRMGRAYIYSGKINTTAITTNSPVTKNFALYQNFPNPFNPTTNIKYRLPKSEMVAIEIFNLMGQKIETLVNNKMPAGLHQVKFNANDLPSGIYLYRIEAGEFLEVKKMILIR